MPHKSQKSNAKGEDATLLVISESGDLGLTPVKLQKAIFLLQKAFPKYFKNSYQFKPYNYGPFDITIYHDADHLAKSGLISKQNTNYSWVKYVATKEGKKTTQEILQKMPKEVADYINELILWLLPLSFEELVSSIYRKYPEYKKNSVFRD